LLLEASQWRGLAPRLRTTDQPPGKVQAPMIRTMGLPPLLQALLEVLLVLLQGVPALGPRTTDRPPQLQAWVGLFASGGRGCRHRRSHQRDPSQGLEQLVVV